MCVCVYEEVIVYKSYAKSSLNLKEKSKLLCVILANIDVIIFCSTLRNQVMRRIEGCRGMRDSKYTKEHIKCEPPK